MLTIWLTLRSRLDQSYLERESVKMSSWTFFCQNGVCLAKWDPELTELSAFNLDPIHHKLGP